MRPPSFRFLLQLAAPLVFVLLVATIVFWSNPHDETRRMTAVAISQLGTVLVLFGNVVWAVFDSKRRWPGVPAFTRFSRIVTFYR